MNDEFELYTLKVEVIASQRAMVCSHQVGDSFQVEGENLIFDNCESFSMYSLSAILPLLPAKQRTLHPNDWMLSDSIIACPDPHCGGQFKISRIAKKLFKHSETTVVPLAEKNNTLIKGEI